jgi:ABC-type antimicrobial peptide transport system permease subunit
VARSLRDDPLSVELLRVLTASALLAAALCLVGLVLTTWSTLRDDGAELYDLEAQGVAPSALARSIRLRAALLGVIGATGGVLLGAGLSALVVDAVSATAATEVPFPPLAVALPWPLWIAGLVAFAVVAWGAVRVVVGRAFADPVPRRPRGGAA